MMRPGERRFVPNTQGGATLQGATQTLFGQAQGRSQEPPVRRSQGVSLMTLAMDLFLIITKIKDTPDIGTPEALKKLLISYLSSFETQCITVGKTHEQIEQARYALAAFIDEITLNRGGEFHEFWVKETLTVKYFNDQVGGENFFTRLEHLIMDMQKNIELLEIFYICLALGFQGRYRMEGAEKLPIVMENLLKRIERVRGKVGQAIAPSANTAPGNISEKGSRKWMIAAFVLLCLSAVFYLVMMFASASGLDEAKQIVHKIERNFYNR